MIATGLDRLLAEPHALRGRRYALLAHGAAVSSTLEPAHLALARCELPALLLAPEHGYYGVEQDMIAARERRDPWTGVPILSLYGDSLASLRPAPETFAGLDLLVVDLQDVGARYYTYVATAVWAAEAAARSGCEVWFLDRPNPLGGEVIEGPWLRPGFESFVGAFELPVRHGLTPGEVASREAARGGWRDALEVWTVGGWRREELWPALGRPWVAPSPNMPGFATATLYPGLCLLEATELSEGRGTTRPFHLLGAPGIDPPRLAAAIGALAPPGLHALPTYFRPQFQKHAGEICGGVELVVTDPAAVRSFAFGVRLLALLARDWPASFAWRREPYEFVTDRPAVDLLAGSADLREGIESSDAGEPEVEAWIAGFDAEEERFREERRPFLLYPEGT